MKTATKFWIVVICFISLIAGYFCIMGYLFSDQLPPAIIKTIIESFKPEYFFILFFPPLIIVLLFFNILFKQWIRPLGKIAEETRVMQTANPSYRLTPSGSYTVRQIGDLINRYADMYEELSINVKEKIDKAGKQTEEEKNTLAAFISELSEGVLICRHDGRLLLYNKKAKEFLTENSSDSASGFIGLGRSVFTLIDKNMVFHALNEIQSKLNMDQENCMASFVIIGKNQNQIKVEAVPVLDIEKSMTGFIFIMTDITTQLVSDKKADMMLQNLT